MRSISLSCIISLFLFLSLSRSLPPSLIYSSSLSCFIFLSSFPSISLVSVSLSLSLVAHRCKYNIFLLSIYISECGKSAIERGKTTPKTKFEIPFSEQVIFFIGNRDKHPNSYFRRRVLRIDVPAKLRNLARLEGSNDQFRQEKVLRSHIVFEKMLCSRGNIQLRRGGCRHFQPMGISIFIFIWN